MLLFSRRELLFVLFKISNAYPEDISVRARKSQRGLWVRELLLSCLVCFLRYFSLIAIIHTCVCLSCVFISRPKSKADNLSCSHFYRSLRDLKKTNTQLLLLSYYALTELFPRSLEHVRLHHCPREHCRCVGC